MFQRTLNGLSLEAQAALLPGTVQKLLDAAEAIERDVVQAGTPRDTGLLAERLAGIKRTAQSVAIGNLEGLHADEAAPRGTISAFVEWYITVHGKRPDGPDVAGGGGSDDFGENAWHMLSDEAKAELREQRISDATMGGPYGDVGENGQPFYYGAVEQGLVPGTAANAGFAKAMVAEMQERIEQAARAILSA